MKRKKKKLAHLCKRQQATRVKNYNQKVLLLWKTWAKNRQFIFAWENWRKKDNLFMFLIRFNNNLLVRKYPLFFFSSYTFPSLKEINEFFFHLVKDSNFFSLKFHHYCPFSSFLISQDCHRDTCTINCPHTTKNYGHVLKHGYVNHYQEIGLTSPH